MRSAMACKTAKGRAGVALAMIRDGAERKRRGTMRYDNPFPRAGRAFDDCFECDDGDTVHALMIRRVETSPELARDVETLAHYMSPELLAAAKRSTVTAAVAPALRCPKCGSEGEETCFRYLEDVVNHREVVGLVLAGDPPVPTLRVNGFYELGEGYDDGKNPRLECQNEPMALLRDGTRGPVFCGHEFPIPDGVELDFG